MLKIDKKSYKDISVYNIGYITIKIIDDCENIYSGNPLYLLINHSNDSTGENKKLLKKYNDVWNRIRDKIKEIRSGGCDYEKDYMKIKFNYDDNLPLKFTNMTITIRSVFEEDGKLYPQVFLDFTWYELNV